ncbi:MAG: family 16 glycosylhydrolase [Candidatus Omnitrophica bacterium]|nr:family 16 glycosylhydrolase [Candidatus Omnitrophota bacterium]
MNALLIFNLVAQENLIKNGDFEIDENKDGLPDYWSVRKVKGSLCKYELDHSIYHSGKFSVKISFEPSEEKDNEGYYFYDFKNFDTGKKYLFSGNIKAENFSGMVALSVDYMDDSFKRIHSIKKKIPVKGSIDWRNLKLYGLVPEGCKNIRIFLGAIGKSGQIWWDNISVREVNEEEKKEKIVISNFEKKEETKIWQMKGVKSEITRENAPEGENGLKVFFPKSEANTWPGLYKELFLNESDWTYFESFNFDVYNPHDEPVTVNLRIDDREGNKFFWSSTCLPKKTSTVTLETDIITGVDIKALKGILIYIRIPSKDYTLIFDNFRFILQENHAMKNVDTETKKVLEEEKVFTEKDFTESLLFEEFKESAINEKSWHFTENGIETGFGNCFIKENGRIMSKIVYPFGKIEAKVAFEKPLTRGAMAFGWREKFGTKPRITISVEERDPNMIKAAIYDDKGSNMTWKNLIPFDTKYHTYTIIWESNNVIKFYVDGNLKITESTKEKISFRPIVFYNHNSDGILSIEYVRFYTSKEIKENLEKFQTQKFEIPGLINFKEVKYIDETPLPDLTNEEISRGYVFFSRPYIDLIFPNSVPREDEIIRNNLIEIYVTKGEFEPLTFAIRGLKDLNDFQIRVSDLVSKQRRKISKDNIRIGIVKTLNKRRLYNIKWSNEYINIPVYVEEKNLINIPKNTNIQIWLTIKIPKDAETGQYFGEISIEPLLGSEAGVKSTINLKVNVLPIELEQPKGKLYGLYYTSKKTTETEILNDFRNMKNYGMTTVGLCIPFNPNKIIEENDSFKFEFKENDIFIFSLEAYNKAGFTEPILLLHGPDRFAYDFLSRKYQDMSKEFEDKFKKFMLSFLEEAKKRKWPGMIFQTFDEPSWRAEEMERKTIRALDILKEIGVLTEIDGPLNDFMIKQVNGRADYLNINGGLAPMEKLKEIKQKGQKVLIYNNDVEGYRPETMRYTAGYYMWIAEIDGVLNWEYQGTRKDPYDDLKDIKSNFIHWYPKTEKETGGPAITYEAFREGIDDYRYLLTHRNMVEKIKLMQDKEAETLAIESEEKIKNLLSKINYTTRIREQAKWAEEISVGPNEKMISGSLKLPNGLSFKDYDEIRKKIIEEILNLHNFLKQRN